MLLRDDRDRAQGRFRPDRADTTLRSRHDRLRLLAELWRLVNRRNASPSVARSG